MPATLIRPTTDRRLDPPQSAGPLLLHRRLPAFDDVTRRELLKGAAALLVAAGCGADRQPVAAPSPTATTRTIEHRYGTTEIAGVPARVVTVGLTDQDPLLALGVTPIGVTDWYGDYPHATWPWAQDALGDAQPEIVGEVELDFERIAALRPDLILGLYTAMTQEEYGLLSQIAPTVAQSGEYDDYEMPWHETTRVVGRAVGRQERAEELVTELEARFTEARAAHPEFEGATAVLSDWDPGIYYPVASDRSRFTAFAALGFEVPQELEELVSDPSYGGNVSAEQLPLFDADVLVWFASDIEDHPGLRAQLADSQLYEQLEAVREGRDLFLDSDDDLLRGALAWNTILSLPLVLDQLVPRLAAAIDGDPVTEPTPASP